MANKKSNPFIQKRVEETTIDVPFYLYKTLDSQEEKVFEAFKSKPQYNLSSQIVIDRRYAQRLLTLWSEDKRQTYLRDFFDGFDKINAFVCVSIHRAIEVLESTKRRAQDKSTINTFIADLRGEIDNGKNWLLINGQHRDKIFQRLWTNEDSIPTKFPIVNQRDIAGKYWSDLDVDSRVALLHVSHPITFVTKFTNMSDLVQIVNLHNEGSEWNPHEKRSIEPSYFMQELRKLDHNDMLKTMFGKGNLNATGIYSPSKKGISFLASQLYLMWKYSKNDWNKFYSMSSNELEDLVKIESEDWSKNSTDEFISFFIKVANELNSFYFSHPSRKKTTKKVIRHKITSFRNYFVLRLIMDRKTNINDIVYKVENPEKFVLTYLKHESKRLYDREQLTDDGKKKWDKLEKKGTLDKHNIKELMKDYKRSECYTELLRGSGRDDYIFQIGQLTFDDFKDDFDNGKLRGIVRTRGENVSKDVKDLVYKRAIMDSESDSIEELYNSIDTKVNEVIHTKTPQAKGGTPTLDNLGLGDVSTNRRQQDKH